MLLITLFGGACTAGEITLGTNPREIKIVPAVRCFAPRYSPDGKWIAFLRGSDPQVDVELWVMGADGQNARVLLTKDTMRYALTLFDLNIHRALPNSEELEDKAKRAPAPESPFARSFAWMPTSDSLICQVSAKHGRGGLYQVMLDGSFRQIPHPLGYLYSVPVMLWGNFLLTPDGKMVAFVGNSGFFRAAIDNIDKSECQGNTGYESHDASWGIDGRIYCAMTPISLLGIENQDTLCDIYAIESNGRIIPLITSQTDDERSPTLSSDGKWLAFTRNRILVTREKATGKETVVLHGLIAYRWLQDGNLLAMTSDIYPVELRSDPLAPRELLEDIVVISPQGGRPVLRILYRTTSIPPLTAGMPPFYRSGNTVVDLTGTRRGMLNANQQLSCLLTMPDISPDGKRMVYEKEGALYMIDLPQMGNRPVGTVGAR
ncbi:MAG: TolB family protein [Armatimonadota bacterium]